MHYEGWRTGIFLSRDEVFISKTPSQDRMKNVPVSKKKATTRLL